MKRQTRVDDESVEGEEDRSSRLPVSSVQTETLAETTHEDMAVKDAVKEIFSRMDAQFREIKESLYFRKIGANIDDPDLEIPSAFPSHPVSGPDIKKLDAKVSPASNIQADIGANKSAGIAKGQRNPRPEPVHISDLYRKELFDTSETFSGKKFRGHKYKCCYLLRCGRDLGLDEYSRDMLWEIFPPTIYYWLIITCAIPTRRVPWLLPLFWFAFAGFKIYLVLLNAYSLTADLLCTFGSNNCISASAGLSYSGTYVLYHLYHAACVFSNILIVPRLLQCRALRSLICTVGKKRVHGSKAWNTFMFVTPIVLLIAGSIQLLYRVLTSVNSQVEAVNWITNSVVEIFIGLAVYTTPFVFWVLHNAVTTAYSDFAMDVLEVAGRKLELYTPAGNPEVVLINRFKSLVSLTARITENARIALLLPLICGFSNVFWTIFAGFRLEDVLWVVINWAARLILPAFLPIIIALIATEAGSYLDRLVTLNVFPNLATFVQNNPSEWMLTLRTPLSIALFFRLSAAVVGLGTLGSLLRVTGSELQRSALWAPVHYDSGSCVDGLWSGLEDHVDCGGALSGCSSTCVEKYGHYLVIEATRDCSDVPGYMEIRTQHACEIAYASFDRVHTNASTLERVPAAVVLDAGSGLGNVSASALRCGCHPREGFLTKQVLFPVLISPAALDSTLPMVHNWRLYPEGGLALVDEKKGKYFAPGVLCMARAHTCPSTSPWGESMSCRAKASAAPDSPWTVASQPWVNITSRSLLTGEFMNKNPMSVTTDGDCAHVTLKDFGSTYGGHVVLRISCKSERGCGFNAMVRSGECSKVSALVSLVNAERHHVASLCGSKKGLQVNASSGDHVHVIADFKSGPFEIDFCV